MCENCETENKILQVEIINDFYHDQKNKTIADIEKLREIINSIKSRVENLETKISTTDSRKKLNYDQVIEIREMHASGDPVRTIADRYGVSTMAVRNIITQKSWKI